MAIFMLNNTQEFIYSLHGSIKIPSSNNKHLFSHMKYIEECKILNQHLIYKWELEYNYKKASIKLSKNELTCQMKSKRVNRRAIISGQEVENGISMEAKVTF